MRRVWRRTKTICPDLQKRVHHHPLGRLEPTRCGPNASCTIRQVLSVIAPHLEMAPPNESHLLAWCVRISFGGEVQRRDVPASERALREVSRPQSITCFYRWIGTRPRGGARTYGAAHARVRSLAHKGDAMWDRGRVTMGECYRGV